MTFLLFDSENEMEQSFSDFEKEQCNEASNPTINAKTLQSSRRSRRTQNNGPGKVPGKNLKKKVPAKRNSSNDKMPMKKAKQSVKVDSNNNTTSILNDLLSKSLEQITILNKNIESGGINIPEVQNQECTHECQQQSDEFDYNQYDDSIL